MSEPRYLVTGVAGFIGSAIARALLAQGHAVRGVDNFATGRRENLAGLKGLDLMEGDLADPKIAAAACSGVSCIFHEAAIPSVPRSVADPAGTHRANVTATVELLVAARDAGVARVVYAASSSAYGNQPTLPKREDMLPDPLSPYAAAKLAGEYYLRSFHAVYGLPTVALRYFNVFGPHQDPHSPYSAVLAKFITLMLAGKTPTIDGDGEQSRDFTYIDNVVHANLLAAAAPEAEVAGRMFNAATGVRVTLNQVVAQLRDLTGYRGEVKNGPPRTGDVKHSLADISLARRHLGYAPQVDFATGLERTVAWYRQSLAAGG
jgi:UDP-glucose 4-epimerase